MAVERDPKPGQRSPIYGEGGKVVGSGTWTRQTYVTPEGTKDFMTVVPDARTAEKLAQQQQGSGKGTEGTANAQNLGHSLQDVEYENDFWNN